MSMAVSRPPSKPLAIVVMGVAGSGKSTIGQAIATELQAVFVEGDAYHPVENIAKMSAGTPLDDNDRWPWLEAVGSEIGKLAVSGTPVVAACSALRRNYRDVLRTSAGCSLIFVMLEGTRTLIGARMAGRSGHFMPESLLDSQFATLEALQSDERAVLVDLDQPIHAIMNQVMTGLAHVHN